MPDTMIPGSTHALHVYDGVGVHGWEYYVPGPCEPSEASANPSLPGQILTAFQRIPLPRATLSIQPPDGRTLIGLPTIFSTSERTLLRTLTLLGQRVQLRITPTSYEWVAGDGTEPQVTDWPGHPWQKGRDDYISHTYEDTGTVRAQVNITWGADYRLGTGPWQPVKGTVTRPGVPVNLQILQARPELVAP